LAKIESELASREPAAGGSAQSGSATPDSIAALEKEFAELKANSAQTEQLAKRLSDLQIAAGGHELLAQSIRDIQSSVASTQGEVERLSAQVGSFGGHMKEIDAALAQRRQEALRAEAVILGVGQLRAAASGSQPFIKEVTALRSLTGSDSDMTPVLDMLQPLAQDGVPTLDELRGSFSHIAGEIVRSAVVGDGEHWWRQALYHLESVISIRRSGADAPGDSTDAIVARGEAKLDEDDLAGAVSALGALAGPAAQVAQPWLADAEHRLALDKAQSDLTQLAIDRLATGRGEAATGQPAGKAP
jgi:hypothetical protein